MKKVAVGILFIVPAFIAFAQVDIEQYFEGYNLNKDVYEAGYSIDHGSWSEIHTWYGKTLEEATTAYTLDK